MKSIRPREVTRECCEQSTALMLITATSLWGLLIQALLDGKRLSNLKWNPSETVIEHMCDCPIPADHTKAIRTLRKQFQRATSRQILRAQAGRRVPASGGR